MPGVPPISRVVMLGFMCSGKSVVGATLAHRLGWSYLDFDREIEAREERSVAAIIEVEGEEAFRAREAALTAEVAARAGVVVAPGGGWITRPELLRSLGAETFAVWLRTTPEETVRRLRSDCVDRPFRDHPEALPRIRQMLEEREPLYRQADLVTPTDGRSIEAIAFEIEMVVRFRSQG